jgi:hypothetical protein
MRTLTVTLGTAWPKQFRSALADKVRPACRNRSALCPGAGEHRTRRLGDGARQTSSSAAGCRVDGGKHGAGQLRQRDFAVGGGASQ